MDIRIKNKPKSMKMASLKIAINLFGKKLLSKKLFEQIEVELIFVQNFNKNQKAYGICEWIDNNDRPKWFEITIDKDLSEKQIIKTIAHEMVHLKQFATGQMKDMVRTPATRWEGKLYTVPDNYDLSLDYWFTPWEIEAYGLENGLYVMYKRYMQSLEEVRKMKE